MLQAIRTIHDVFTLLALGILLGAGAGLAWTAIKWPWTNNYISGAAFIICLLVILIAIAIP